MNGYQGLIDTNQDVHSREDGAAQRPSAQNQNGLAISDQKRVIWITGSKGGTGKSTCARGLAHTLQVANKDFAAYDGDPENAQLFRYYNDVGNGVTCIGLKQRDGVDDILSEMHQAGTPLILVDVPAGGGEILVGLEEDIGFFSALSELGYGLTMVSLLSCSKDSVNQLKRTIEITEGYDVAHVAVKNLFYGTAKEFALFDDSRTKRRLLENGGLVIEMRDLLKKTYDRLDKFDFSFQAALETDSDMLSWPDARRVKQWTKHFEQQVTSTGGLFGL